MIRDDDELTLESFRRHRATGDASIRDDLITRYAGLAQACARRFANRGEPLDDLEQVALLALVKAVDRFDPERGYPFAGFAVPTVMGELRRHFRDKGWTMSVRRRVKDLHVRIPAAVESLTQELGGAPTVVQIAEFLDATVEEVLEAMDAAGAYRPASLDSVEPGRSPVGDVVGENDPELALAQLRGEVVDLLAGLEPRERQIIYLRFFEEMSQSEIAERVGTSQVHVSRLIRASLDQMRSRATT